MFSFVKVMYVISGHPFYVGDDQQPQSYQIGSLKEFQRLSKNEYKQNLCSNYLTAYESLALSTYKPINVLQSRNHEKVISISKA